jgi:UDP-3-O-[3-hydroxymyristoyl] glucosamine N-acyltransferase
MTDKQRERLEFAKTHKEKWIDNEIHPSAIIHPTAVIGEDGFGFAREVDGSYIKMPHAGNVVIHEGVEVRAFCTIDRGVVGSTLIGEGNKLDHHVHVAHNVQIGKYNTFANGCCIEGSCEIGSYNTFGSNVVVQRKVKVGSRVRVGSGTVITKDVPDRAVIVGNPNRILRFQDE